MSFQLGVFALVGVMMLVLSSVSVGYLIRVKNKTRATSRPNRELTRIGSYGYLSPKRIMTADATWDKFERLCIITKQDALLSAFCFDLLPIGLIAVHLRLYCRLRWPVDLIDQQIMSCARRLNGFGSTCQWTDFSSHRQMTIQGFAARDLKRIESPSGRLAAFETRRDYSKSGCYRI
jgi:hypothetical protein